jgi:hypothetical protein
MTPAMQQAVAVGFDAMRIALGGRPRTYTLEEIICWLRLMGQQNNIR